MYMKKFTWSLSLGIIWAFWFLIIASPVSAQVGVNTVDPDPSSMLDIRSTERGLLIPRMDPVERQSLVTRFTNPASSLMVFDTDHRLFYYFDRTQPGINGESGAWVAMNPWMMRGTYNSTNDNAAYFMGNIGIGTPNPSMKLVVVGNTSTDTLFTRVVKARNNAGLKLYDNENNGIYIEDKGRVGINVENPNDRLDVGGSIDITGIYKFANRPVLVVDTTLNCLLVGENAGLEKGNGYTNICIGNESGRFMEEGDRNILLGHHNGYNLHGSRNICIGTSAGSYGMDDNIVIGHSPGSGLSSGSRNILIGNGLSIMGSNNFAIGHKNALLSGDFDYRLVNVIGRLYVHDSLEVGKNVRIEGKLRVEGELFADAGCVGCTSDTTLKRNIQVVHSSLDKICRLDGYTYLWKEATNQYRLDKDLQMGFMAQEIQREFPLLVDTSSTGHLYVDYQKMVVPLLISVKELKTELDQKDQKIKSLEERLARIEKLLQEDETRSSNK